MTFLGYAETLNFQHPKNQEIGLPRRPKVSQMKSKQIPEVSEFKKMWWKWNLMKTTVFTVLLGGLGIRIQQIFHSKTSRKHTCNSNMLMDISNHRNYQKVTQNGPEWSTQNSQKIILGALTASAPNLLTRMVPKWSPRTSEWTQNDYQGLKKYMKISEFQ